MGLNSQKMNLDTIRTFVVLSQSRNMTEVSIKLKTTPSSVSRHIMTLEEELGTKLIINSKHQDLKLTEDGLFFFEKYEKIYNDILLAEKEYNQSKELDNCKISIGINRNLEEKILMPAITSFIDKYKNLSIKVVNGSTEELAKKLSQYSLDIIIDKEPPIITSKLTDIKTNKLFSTNYCIIYNKKYFNDVNDLSSIPFIMPVNDSQERLIIDEYFDRLNVTPNIKLELENITSIISYVEKGMGVAIVSKNLIEIKNNIGIKDLDIESEVYLSFNKNKITSSTKEFINYLK